MNVQVSRYLHWKVKASKNKGDQRKHEWAAGQGNQLKVFCVRQRPLWRPGRLGRLGRARSAIDTNIDGHPATHRLLRWGATGSWRSFSCQWQGGLEARPLTGPNKPSRWNANPKL